MRVTQSPAMVWCEHVPLEVLQVVFLHTGQHNQCHVAHGMPVLEVLACIVRKEMDGCKSCQHIMFQHVIEHSTQGVAVVATRVIVVLTAWVVAEEVQVLSLPDLLTTIHHLPVLDDNNKIINILDLTLTLRELETHKVHDDGCFTHG